MNDNADQPEPTVPLPGQSEAAVEAAIDAPAEEPDPPKRRRGAVITGVAVVLVALIGGGAYAAWQVLSGGGPQPDEALPDSTIAMVSIDLDPSASQKIEAIKTLRKFPALKETLGLDTKDDLRRWIFEKAVGEESCDGVSYSDDVEPWIGERAAVAAVDLGGDEPVPAVALAVTDPDGARKGLQDVLDCADGDDEVFFAVGEDYLIASDTEEHAEAVLAAGKKKPLADDTTYQDFEDKVGDRGVVSFYVSSRAVDLLVDVFGEELGSGFDEELDEGTFGESAPPTAARAAEDDCSEDPAELLKDQFKDFKGLAGTIRFADSGMELAVVGTGVDQGSGASAGKQVGSLPSDTAIALGFAVPDDYAEQFVDNAQAGLCELGDDLVGELEAETGLSLPEDLQTLLGTALTLSIGDDVPQHLADIEDFSELPVGVAVHGDGEAVQNVIAKIEDAVGGRLADVGIGAKTSEDRLVLSTSEDYADALLEKGSLGEESAFRDAVPEAAKSFFILYLDFDSKLRDTLVQLAEDEGADDDLVRDLRENSDPLRSLGISAWQDGEDSHVLLKIATD